MDRLFLICGHIILCQIVIHCLVFSGSNLSYLCKQCLSSLKLWVHGKVYLIHH